MEYELESLRPSQERRLKTILIESPAQMDFLAKLKDYLAQKLRGGEAERDYVKSLATRLTAQNLWNIISDQHLLTAAIGSDPDRFSAFLDGLPTQMSGRILDEIKREQDLVEKDRRSNYRKPVSIRKLPLKLRIGSFSGGKISVEAAGGKREQLIAKYADELRTKLRVEPDMTLLRNVTISCGPSIYQEDSATISSSDTSELELVKDRFLVKKLGLADSPELMKSIHTIIESYGRAERIKYRAVVYYMLADRFHKAARIKELAEGK